VREGAGGRRVKGARILFIFKSTIRIAKKIVKNMCSQNKF